MFCFSSKSFSFFTYLIIIHWLTISKYTLYIIQAVQLQNRFQTLKTIFRSLSVSTAIKFMFNSSHPTKFIDTHSFSFHLKTSVRPKFSLCVDWYTCIKCTNSKFTYARTYIPCTITSNSHKPLIVHDCNVTVAVTLVLSVLRLSHLFLCVSAIVLWNSFQPSSLLSTVVVRTDIFSIYKFQGVWNYCYFSKYKITKSKFENKFHNFYI